MGEHDGDFDEGIGNPGKGYFYRELSATSIAGRCFLSVYAWLRLLTLTTSFIHKFTTILPQLGYLHQIYSFSGRSTEIPLADPRSYTIGHLFGPTLFGIRRQRVSTRPPQSVHSTTTTSVCCSASRGSSNALSSTCESCSSSNDLGISTGMNLH